MLAYLYIPNNMRGDDIILALLLLLLYPFAYALYTILYSYLHNIIVIVHREVSHW